MSKGTTKDSEVIINAKIGRSDKGAAVHIKITIEVNSRRSVSKCRAGGDRCRAGYDHIVAAIGASLSSAYGADFICYVTPAEHLALPDVEDVRMGTITARIAAHIGDMIKNNDRQEDLDMGRARRDMLWEKQFQLAIDPETAKLIRADRTPSDAEVCTMCGDFCALKIIKENIDLAR